MSSNAQKALWQESATALAKAIRTKQTSSLEVVQAHLNRIEAINGRLNALTSVLAEEALDAAKAADQAIAAGMSVGPLHGVPITLKDNLDLAGSATTFGIVDLKGAMPESDAPVVAHLKRAGAIPLGRSNLPGFGFRWHTDNDLFGATLNPWDLSRTPGGSSGGEAAAVASGLSPLGIGGDMGGSLRYPAQCCGIAALKPGLGRVSRIATRIFSDPPLFYQQVAEVSGPMARSVQDLRLALTVMAQPDPEDPWWTPVPPGGFPVPSSATVAVVTEVAEFEGATAVRDGVGKAANLLAEAGYAVEEAHPPMVEEAWQTLEELANTETRSYAATMLPMMSTDSRKIAEEILEMGGKSADLDTYMNAIARRHHIAAAWQGFMTDYPLILTSVSALEPFEVGYDLTGRDNLQRFVRSLGLTEICNLLGLPSVVVPAGIAEGLPQAVQVIGPRLHEELCLDAAEIIERASGILTPIEPGRGRSQASGRP